MIRLLALFWLSLTLGCSPSPVGEALTDGDLCHTALAQLDACLETHCQKQRDGICGVSSTRRLLADPCEAMTPAQAKDL